jgi:hypothetical protein
METSCNLRCQIPTKPYHCAAPQVLVVANLGVFETDKELHAVQDASHPQADYHKAKSQDLD